MSTGNDRPVHVLPAADQGESIRGIDVRVDDLVRLGQNDYRGTRYSQSELPPDIFLPHERPVGNTGYL